MTTTGLDIGDLTALARDLGKAQAGIAKDVRGIVNHGALKIKQGMQRDIGRSPHFKAVAADISYDLEVTATSVEAEIGPVVGRGKGHAGGIAGIPAFGTEGFDMAHGSSTHGPTWDYASPLKAEGKVVVDLLGDLIGDIL